MIALISLVGCSSPNAPAATSTGSSTAAAAATSTSSSGGNTNATTHAQAVKFAECIRDNGVTEFPDPDASGSFAYGIKRGSSLDPSTAAWQKAIGACKDLEPPGALGGKASPQEQKARLKFAQCMRDNGVQDFPDPTTSGPLIDVQDARSIPGFQAAMQKCRDVMASALGGQ
jgi:putative hemolysin